MPKVSGSGRWMRLSATALLVFGGLGALYFFSYVSSKRADYADRSFRALSTVAEDFVGRLKQVESTLGQVSKKASKLRDACGISRRDRCSAAFIDNTIDSTIALTPGLRPEEGASDFDPARLLIGANGLAIHVDPIRGRLRYRYRVRPDSTAHYASAALGDQIEATHLRNLFDEVLVATEQGDVVYREGGGFGLTDLSTLVTTEAEPLRLDSVRGASRSVEVEVGGKAQHIFLHPFSIPFSAIVRGIDSDGVRLVDELLLVGLVRSAEVAAKSRQLPSTFVLILFALVMSGVLAAPFLKVWFLGESERFGMADVALLVGAGFVGTALTTFALLDLAAYSSVRSQLDAESDSLASEILSDFARELSAGRRQLTGFFENESLRLGSAAPDTNDVTQIWQAEGEYFDPDGYPYLEMMYWADATGMQRQKWTVRREATPRVDIGDRRYYRTALLPALATPTLGAPTEHEILNDERDRFAFELIQSRTTGQSLLAVSIPLDGLDRESSHVAGSVGGLVTQPISLGAPVLPMGMRFAFVEADGRIALTSDLRQRRENLLQECGDDRLLASALAARRAEEMTVRCYGAEWRFYLKPVGDQPYSLVMMRDLTLLGALNFEVLMTGLLFYCIPLVLILTGIGVLFLLIPSAIPSWIWPDADRVPAYFQAASVAVAAGAFFVIGEGLALTGATLQLTIVLPLLVLAMVILILGRDPKSPAWGFTAHVPSVLGAATGVSIAVAGGTIVGGVLAGATLAVLASSRAHTVVFSKTTRWGELGLRFGYAGLPVWLLLSLGVGAPYVLFQDAFDHALESWARASQLHSVRAELEHDQRAAARYAGSGLTLPPKVGSSAPLGVYRSVFFQETAQRCGTPHDHGEQVGSLCPTLSTVTAAGEPPLARDANLGQVRWPDQNTRGLAGLTRRHFTSLISAHGPVYNPAIERTRRIAIDRLEDNRWRWSLPDRHHTLLFRYDVPNTDSLIQVASTIPRWSWVNLRPYTVLLAVVGLVIGAIVFGLSHNIMRLVFGLDLESEVTLDYRERIDLNLRENRLLLGPPRETIEWLAGHADTHYVDLTTGIADSDRATDAPVVVLDHFDYKLDDPERARLRYELVSHHVFVRRKRVILISGLDPLYYLGEVLPAIRPEESEVKGPTAEDWADLLSKFQKGRFAPTTRASTRKSRRSVTLPRGSVFSAAVIGSFEKRKERLSAILEEECGDDLNLKRYADEIRDYDLFPTLTERQVVAMLGESAEAYYRTLWNTCSVPERLILLRLARHAFVNPKSWHVARRLKQRGLIEKDPAVVLKNESFKQFVLQAEKPATIGTWLEEHAVSPWSKLRSPLLFTAVVIGVFFFFTQRDQLNASMAFITSFAAAIPAAIRLLSLTVGQGRSTPGAGSA